MLLIFENNKSFDLKALSPNSLSFLQEEALVDSNKSPINWEDLSLERQQYIVKCLAVHEANNVAFCEKNYQQVRNRSIYGTLGLIIVLSLFSIGLILLPTIVPIITIPFLPVFLLCVAITAFARIFFKSHETYCDTEHRRAKKLLDDLKEIQADLLITSVEQEPKDEFINQNLSEQIQKISDNVEQVKKVVQESMATLMARKGTFKSDNNAEILANGLTTDLTSSSSKLA